jgi:hypothetical protein
MSRLAAIWHQRSRGVAVRATHPTLSAPYTQRGGPRPTEIFAQEAMQEGWGRVLGQASPGSLPALTDVLPYLA